MKKSFVLLAASFILIFSATYASPDNSKVPAAVSYTFSRDFSYASNVNWEMIAGYYKVSFSEHGKTLFAFYTREAEFMGIATPVVSDNLPVPLRAKIKANYGDYWITDLFMYNVNGEPVYFIALENADQKIMLKAEGKNSWAFYKNIIKD